MPTRRSAGTAPSRWRPCMQELLCPRDVRHDPANRAETSFAERGEPGHRTISTDSLEAWPTRHGSPEAIAPLLGVVAAHGAPGPLQSPAARWRTPAEHEGGLARVIADHTGPGSFRFICSAFRSPSLPGVAALCGEVGGFRHSRWLARPPCFLTEGGAPVRPSPDRSPLSARGRPRDAVAVNARLGLGPCFVL